MKRLASVAVVLLVSLVGCSVGSGATPGSSVPPSPTPVGSPAWPAEASAVAAVLASDPSFRGFAPRDPGLVGQDRWYEAAPSASAGFTVTLHVGWGDCPAGCIHQHDLVFEVQASGQVRAAGSSGEPLPPGLLPGGTAGATATLAVHASASPTCPVERPGQPGCEPAPVIGSVIVRSPEGRVVTRGRTDPSGDSTLTVPGGVYLVSVSSDTRFPSGDTKIIVVSVADGGSVPVFADFDTGIR